MKTSLCVVLFLTLRMGLCFAMPELDALESKIRAELPGTEWQIVKDWRSITVTRSNVQFLNPISLPPATESELWNQYSFTSDYRITITLDTKMTQSEYLDLLRVKQNWTAQRTAGMSHNTKDFWSASQGAQGVVRLPSYYLNRFSVYLYTSDDSFFRIRPDSVTTARDKILAILEKSCSNYSATPEPNGPAKRSQLIPSETNRISGAGGPRR